MDCGDTFLMPAPGGAATPHLWIIITQPDPITHECAIVSVTTLRNSKDQTIFSGLAIILSYVTTRPSSTATR